jgi:hypothetical protein
MKKLLLLALLCGLAWFFGSGKYLDYKVYYEPYTHSLFSSSQTKGPKPPSKEDVQQIAKKVSELQQQEEQLSKEIKTLQEQQEQRAKELAQTNEKLTTAQTALIESEAKAQKAEEKAKEMQCEATVAGLDAEVRLRQAQCFDDWSVHLQCKAEKEAKRSGNTLFFTLLGAGAAALTGGSSLLLTGGGAVVGYASGGGENCGRTPPCEVGYSVLEERVLEEKGASVNRECFVDDEELLLPPAFGEEDVDEVGNNHANEDE